MCVMLSCQSVISAISCSGYVQPVTFLLSWRFFCCSSSCIYCYLLTCCPHVYLKQEQASWVCRCEDRVVQRLEQDFKLTLQQQNSLEQWAAWLDGVVSQVLKPYQHSPAFPKAAKLFLLKWSFYRWDGKNFSYLPLPLLRMRIYYNSTL